MDLIVNPKVKTLNSHDSSRPKFGGNHHLPLILFFVPGQGANTQMSFCLKTPNDTPPSSLMDSTTNSKVKTMEGKGIGARSLTRSTSRVEGHVVALR